MIYKHNYPWISNNTEIMNFNNKTITNEKPIFLQKSRDNTWGRG